MVGYNRELRIPDAVYLDDISDTPIFARVLGSIKELPLIKLSLNW